jgi:formylglycine-generating enzyme required for sulfatase activity
MPGIEGYTDGFPTTAPVMSFKPNKLGLYDMGGNVYEWCEDSYDSSRENRTLRGGAWSVFVRDQLLLSYRRKDKSDLHDRNYGFRIVVETHGPK